MNLRLRLSLSLKSQKPNNKRETKTQIYYTPFLPTQQTFLKAAPTLLDHLDGTYLFDDKSWNYYTFKDENNHRELELVFKGKSQSAMNGTMGFFYPYIQTLLPEGSGPSVSTNKITPDSVQTNVLLPTLPTSPEPEDHQNEIRDSIIWGESYDDQDEFRDSDYEQFVADDSRLEVDALEPWEIKYLTLKGGFYDDRGTPKNMNSPYKEIIHYFEHVLGHVDANAMHIIPFENDDTGRYITFHPKVPPTHNLLLNIDMMDLALEEPPEAIEGLCLLCLLYTSDAADE